MDIHSLGPEKSALMSATKKGPNKIFKILSHYLVGMASAGLIPCLTLADHFISLQFSGLGC